MSRAGRGDAAGRRGARPGPDAARPPARRIASLSGALDELHAEFKALKERLGELTARFEGVEAFVDQLSAARRHGPRPAKRRRVLTQPAWP